MNYFQIFSEVWSSFIDRFIFYSQLVYCFLVLRKKNKVVVFLTPGDIKINGGVLSIYSLAEASRKALDREHRVILCTYPNHLTYLFNNKFKNKEFIVSFNCFLRIAALKYFDEVLIHIPEYYSKFFLGALTESQIQILSTVKTLKLNILNQNIEQLPEPQLVKPLKVLTHNLSITCSHSRFCTQKLSDEYSAPVHFLSVSLRSVFGKNVPFEKKKHCFVISPDFSPFKSKIINFLKENFPEWKIVEIKNMTYEEYLKLISESYFTISFGEGFDSYFIQPFFNNSIGISVFNPKFFPDSTWQEFDTVFSSYDELITRLVPTIENLLGSREEYIKLQKQVLEKLKTVYSRSDFEKNLKSFYKQDYDFVPSKKIRSNEKVF